MGKIGDRRVNNGGARPGAGRPLSRLTHEHWIYTPEGRVNLVEYCKASGYDPVVAMIEIADDEKLSPAIRLSAHREVSKYVHPTLGRYNVEHSGKIEGDLGAKDLDELRRMADEFRQRDT